MILFFYITIFLEAKILPSFDENIFNIGNRQRKREEGEEWKFIPAKDEQDCQSQQGGWDDVGKTCILFKNPF